MSRARQSLDAFIMIALISVLTAGCSGAPASSTGGGGNSPAATNDQGIKFARCMRDNGIAAFPDPDASGARTIDGIANGTSLDTESAAFTQALGACKDLQLPGFTGNRRSAEQQAAALKFAQCMRDNGIRDFPDPLPDGPILDTSRMPGSPGALSIPGFKAAQETCGVLYGREMGVGER
jgi:hypothetical protein